ncbi:hypothetical protein [Mesomycoplasma ovipneumoniae]|uniref:hypothetical protein n=1 Tax=Mesomycoplasma ovipneumoniae TaxID=29562 RepID=UPI00083E81C4|nr:hypothetical protein [Mesomycoplasma ovipneumoniae]
MANIFDLELKNLSKKEKKYWLEYFTAFDSDRMKETERWVAWSESVKKSKNRDLTEKTLGKHFADNRDLFFHFQNHHKNSLYNQALKKHGFKKLNYKDMVENLTPT